VLLQARGVGAGDRVMLVGENCLAHVAATFAATELGAWPVLVNARLSAREIEVVRAHCRPRLALFTVAASDEAARHAAAASARTVDCGAAGRIGIGPTDLRALAEPVDVARDVAALIYTSGTTGSPKGVMITHRGLLHFCSVSARSRALGASDRVYAALPMSHIFGLATQLLATLYGGAGLWLERAFDAARAYRALSQEGITILQGVPTMFARLLGHMRAHGLQPRFPGLRYAYTGGGPLDPALKKEFESACRLVLHHGYGMTEYAGSMAITRIDRPRADCASGQVNEGCSARLVDAQGRTVGAGGVGEIWVRGPGVMRGYYREPGLTSEVLDRNGWLHTGDLGRIDDDGALHVVGRTKDLIIRSGFNVYPVEVESVIAGHPGVRLNAVVGRTTSDGNEEVIAFVEPRAGSQVDDAQLRDFVRERLAPYKRPARYVLVSELPVTANGKVRKQELRDRLGGGQG
jgi:long-chain acyl-CoA synthetase